MRVLLTALLFQTFLLAEGTPRIIVDSSQFSFNRVLRDTKVTHRFTLRNGGEAPLRLFGLRVSCGCMSTLVGKDLLEPGDETAVDVTLNTTGMAGPIRKTVRVLSDDPVSPDLELVIDANVATNIQVPQDEFTFQDVAPGFRRKFTAKLESLTGQEITLSDVELSPAPWLGVKTREAGKTLFVDMDFSARKLPRGVAAGMDTVALKVSNPDPAYIVLKVHWSRRAPVAARPERVVWDGPTSQNRETVVTIEQADRRPFGILSARTTSPSIRVAGSHAKPARSQAVRISLDPAVPPGNYTEKVILTLDLPGKPEFEIRVSAVIRPAPEKQE